MLGLYDLTVEFTGTPLLVPTAGLRFGWKLNSDRTGVVQRNYRLSVLRDGAAVFDTGVTESAQNFDICPAGLSLDPMTDYTLAVEVCDNCGERAAATLDFSTAPCVDDWSGTEWIRPERHITGWAPWLRTRFRASGVTRAILYASGLGCAEYTLNGQRADDGYIDPPMTDYTKRVFYRRFDVTGLVRTGENTLAVHLGEGFYAQNRCLCDDLEYGPECLRLMLYLYHADGSAERIVTAPDTWQYRYGPVVLNNVYAGETYDARLEFSPWQDDDGWGPTVADETPKGEMTPCLIPPVRVLRELPAVSVYSGSGKQDGAWIFDLGENFAGIAEFRLPPAKPGTRYDFRFAEALNEGGGLDFRSTGSFATQCIQQVTYICKGDPDGEVFRPHFCYFGFRYVEMTGLHDYSDGYGTFPSVSMVRGLQLSTDFAKTGSFHTSHTDLDRFYRLMDNTYRSNFHGFPEDCPAREKCGWLGDAQVCVNYGLLNYDSTAAYEKYLEDIRTTREVFGTWQMIAPGRRGCGEAAPLWGCAQIVIPYTLWQYAGDSEAVTRNFPAMEDWVAHELARAEDYCIGEGLGDWDPPGHNDNPHRMPVNHSSTFAFYEICRLMEQMSTAFGMGDAAYYGRLSGSIRDAAIERFYDRKKHTYGFCGSDGVALALGLYPDGEKAALTGALLSRIRAYGYAMPTGIYGNKYLIPVLMEAGQTDTTMRYLFDRDSAGFGRMLEEGATAIWEDPDTHAVSDRDVAVDSHDHPMHGAFLYVCHTHAAGLRPLSPGFVRFALQPCHGETVDTVQAELSTPVGRVAVCFERTACGHRYRLDVPVNAICELRLDCAEKITVNGTAVQNGSTLGSGHYLIETKEVPVTRNTEKV